MVSCLLSLQIDTHISQLVFAQFASIQIKKILSLIKVEEHTIMFIMYKK